MVSRSIDRKIDFVRDNQRLIMGGGIRTKNQIKMIYIPKSMEKTA
jgi:heptaprenylglyceryl phosphate synthase